LGVSSAFGIEFLLVAGRFPKRDQVVKIPFIVLADLECERE